MPCLLIEKLSKVFAGPTATTALNELSLEIADRELLVLVGPSGAGKTTLLRIIAGLEAPSTGDIILDGKVINILPAEKRGVAMVFQDHSLYPHLTVAENLGFGLKLRKLPKAEIEQRVREVADWLDLTRLSDRLPQALSGGERQRVALGRALALKPQLLLLDEPLSDLDAPLRAQMRRDIADLHRRLGLTMIYVTHDQVEAMTLAERMGVLEKGALQQVGQPIELYRHPATLFVAGFIGNPPMNLLPGAVEFRAGAPWLLGGADPHVSKEPAALQLAANGAADLSTRKGTPLVLGLRAESISLSPTQAVGSGENACLAALVERVEPLGSETHVHLKSGTWKFIARAPAETDVRIGETVFAKLNLGKARYFDGNSGRALEL